MDNQLVELGLADWNAAEPNEAWIAALEAGKVLYFPRLGFELLASEQALLTPALLLPDVRNISLDANGHIKGVAGGEEVQRAAAAMVGRFRAQAQQLVQGLLPHYTAALRYAPTSYRPAQVESRVQSWRADDRRMHVDSFPSRPNYGERILRVFTNANPHGKPRVWRVGEPFEDVVRRFLPPCQTLFTLAGQGAAQAACDQVAAQRIRPPDAAVARQHEVGPRLPEKCASADHAFPAWVCVGVFFGPDVPRSGVGPVHAGTNTAFARVKAIQS